MIEKIICSIFIAIALAIIFLIGMLYTRKNKEDADKVAAESNQVAAIGKGLFGRLWAWMVREWAVIRGKK